MKPLVGDGIERSRPCDGNTIIHRKLRMRRPGVEQAGCVEVIRLRVHRGWSAEVARVKRSAPARCRRLRLGCNESSGREKRQGPTADSKNGALEGADLSYCGSNFCAIHHEGLGVDLERGVSGTRAKLIVTGDAYPVAKYDFMLSEKMRSNVDVSDIDQKRIFSVVSQA